MPIKSKISRHLLKSKISRHLLSQRYLLILVEVSKALNNSVFVKNEELLTPDFPYKFFYTAFWIGLLRKTQNKKKC